MVNYNNKNNKTAASFDIVKDMDSLRSELQRVRRTVDLLEDKVRWYEGCLRWLVYLCIFCAFVAGEKRKQLMENRKNALRSSSTLQAENHRVYKVVQSGNSEFHGMMRYRNISRFDVMRDGFGTEYFKETNAIKGGLFIEDKLQGFGHVVWDNEKYEGQWKDDIRHGFGFSVYGDGGWYRGSYEHGNREGYGILQKPAGEQWQGTWVNNHLNDTNAKITYTNQSMYIGSVSNQKRNGDGSFYWPNGIRFEATWKDDRPTSQGTFVVPLIRTVRGNWEDYGRIAASLYRSEEV